MELECCVLGYCERKKKTIPAFSTPLLFPIFLGKCPITQTLKWTRVHFDLFHLATLTVCALFCLESSSFHMSIYVDFYMYVIVCA